MGMVPCGGYRGKESGGEATGRRTLGAMPPALWSPGWAMEEMGG